MSSEEVIARLEGGQPVIIEESKYPSISQLEKDIRVNIFWRNAEWAGGLGIGTLSVAKVVFDFITGSVNPATLAIETGAVVAGVLMVVNGLKQGGRYCAIEQAAEKAGLLRPPQFHLPFRLPFR